MLILTSFYQHDVSKKSNEYKFVYYYFLTEGFKAVQMALECSQ